MFKVKTSKVTDKRCALVISGYTILTHFLSLISTAVSPTLVGDLSGKTLEQLEQMRAEKRARLQEALEPVSLEEIRKQRASKRAQGI
ncbi:hypothetical protein DPMN_027631 [Dreissena polymorpha]|uniref:Uncharacterized protein n=1 Tax=Dreissena polymorpha TaxID=45954 RepID=A0A9D4LVL1_DREPO|nr:hypothetical protein DPMN_027631 [Dreissena polymorpha]